MSVPRSTPSTGSAVDSGEVAGDPDWKVFQELTEARWASEAAENERSTRVYGLLNHAMRRVDVPPSETTLDAAELYLMLQAKLDPRWSIWAEFEYEHEAKAGAAGSGTGEIRVDRAFITHRTSDALELKLGEFFAPWGIWNRIHWKPRVPTWTAPLSLERELLPIHAAGAGATGTSRGSRKAEYSVCVFGNRETGSGASRADGSIWALGDFGYRPGSRWHVGLTVGGIVDPAAGQGREHAAAFYGRGYLDQKRRVELWVEGIRSLQPVLATGDLWGQLQWEFTRKYFLGFRWDALTRDVQGAGLRHERSIVYLDHKPRPTTILGFEVVRDSFEAPSSRDATTALLRVGTVFGGL